MQYNYDQTSTEAENKIYILINAFLIWSDVEALYMCVSPLTASAAAPSGSAVLSLGCAEGATRFTPSRLESTADTLTRRHIESASTVFIDII